MYEKSNKICNNAVVFKMTGSTKIVARMAYDVWWISNQQFACKDYSGGYAWIDTKGKYMKCPGDTKNTQFRKGGSDAITPGSVVGPKDINSNTEHDTDCPDSWKKFEGKCYKFFTNQKTWTEARSYCQSQGQNVSNLNYLKLIHVLSCILGRFSRSID